MNISQVLWSILPCKTSVSMNPFHDKMFDLTVKKHTYRINSSRKRFAEHHYICSAVSCTLSPHKCVFIIHPGLQVVTLNIHHPCVLQPQPQAPAVSMTADQLPFTADQTARCSITSSLCDRTTSAHEATLCMSPLINVDEKYRMHEWGWHGKNIKWHKEQLFSSSSVSWMLSSCLSFSHSYLVLSSKTSNEYKCAHVVA